MINIKQQFTMTSDAIPIPVTPGRYKLCQNCHRLTRRIAKGLCGRCQVYKHINGQDRPSHLFDLNLLCKNKHCQRMLKDDNHSSAGYCNACYRYRRRNGTDRLAKVDNDNIRSAIKTRRIELGISQRDLAMAIGVSTVGHFERGKASWTLTNVVKACELLGCTEILYKEQIFDL